MRQSPRIRRLNSDFRALEKLRAESTILDFDFWGSPPTKYRVTFRGAGIWRADAESNVEIRETHEVLIDLSAAYPRMMPELSWQTPIFHPNISGSGIVCLGGYGTHWVPSVKLDELCCMLWDMIRYKNFDVESPYNREAAIWAKSATGDFPVDPRPLRDRVATPELVESWNKPPVTADSSFEQLDEVTFIEPEIVEAEIIAPVAQNSSEDIMFID